MIAYQVITFEEFIKKIKYRVCFIQQLETYRIEFFSKILTVKVGDEVMKKIIKYFFDD